MVKTSVHCPVCGRCIGECLNSDETGHCIPLIKPPDIKGKQLVLTQRCKKCKTELYISMSFRDEENSI